MDNATTINVTQGPNGEPVLESGAIDKMKNFITKGFSAQKEADKLMEQESDRVENPAQPDLLAEPRTGTGDVQGVSGERLKLYIERIERLSEEAAGIRDDISDVYAEAKSAGFDSKIMRMIVRLRKMASEKRREEEELLDVYKCAIGMD